MKKDYVTQYLKYWGQLNKETREHSIRVANICEQTAPGLGLDSDVAYIIGYLHDIGKIYVPSRILRKNGKLIPIERDIVDLHSYIGYRLLKELEAPPKIYLPVLYHHGFDKHTLRDVNEPITEDDIIPLTMLLHTIDIYDARSNRRCYHDEAEDAVIFEDLRVKEGMCNDEILHALRKYTERQGKDSER